ncbi:MAG: helicase, partial [Candidatus Makaraimicrobium thalassicum]
MDDTKPIKKGSILKGKLFPETVEVISVDVMEDLTTIYAKGVETGEIYEKVIGEGQLKEIDIVGDYKQIDFSTNPENFFLGIEAKRIRLAFEFDPLFAVNVSKIDPVPHQLEAVYKYILPKKIVRYLLADDPGAGKTIMAGLILKELKMRGLANNCLIISPGHLKYQWLREMKEKFNERFTIIDRSTIDTSYGTDVWKDRRWCITSLDFIRQEEIRETLKNVEWDLVISDEAHKMSAYLYGEKTKKTKRFQVGEVVADNASNLIFLTATPHKGDPDNFRLLLSLLDNDVFSSNESMERILKNNKEEYILRRMKEELKGFDGKRLFPPRDVTTIGYELSKPEKDLYDDVTDYVKKYYKRAQRLMEDRKRRNISLALLVLQRRMASSVRALRSSIENRRRRLQNMLDSHQLVQEMHEIYGDIEDMPEEDRWKVESALESLTTAQSFEELQDEINELDRLIAKARRVENLEVETKLQELRKLTQEHLEKGNPDNKLLVFTEAKATLEYLATKLRDWGYIVTTIHGNMNLEKRIRAEEEFKHTAQILVATEAAGEGVNLQFRWMMVNYDIPWNPNRLEQRMGRIHRYGQKHPIVFIFNMVALNTLEGRVLNKLLEKIEIMKEHLGEDKVYDVVGEILENAKVENLIQKVIFGEKDVADAEVEIDSIDIERTKEEIKKLTSEALALKVDVPWSNEIFKLSEENKLVPEYLEQFFIRGFNNIIGDGKIRRRKDGFLGIDWVPYEIKDIPYDFRMKYGIVDDRYPKFTFDKHLLEKGEIADFISPGHPLMEAVIDKILDKYSGLLNEGAVFEDPDGQLHGLIWFLEGTVYDGNGNFMGKKMFSIYSSQNGEINNISPAILWDLKPSSNDKMRNELFDLMKLKQRVLANAITGEFETYRKMLLNEREREIKIKKEYTVNALKERIELLDLKM